MAVRKDYQEQLDDDLPTDVAGLLAFTDALFKDITPEEWAEIPADSSVNLDHYLYGAPKQQP